MKSSWSDLVVFLSCCFFQSGVYLLARKHYPSSKLRCWVLTCLNSFVTPLLSFRSLFRIVNNRWEYDPVVGGSRSSRFCTLFFMSYLVCELVVGFVDYRKQVSLIMGYVHHVSYLALSFHLLVENRTNILAMSLLEELPTLILACGRLGQLGGSFDFAFGLSFVLTRIVFHLYVQYHMFLWRGDDKLGWYWQVCTLAFGMNVYWLLAWWKSVKRRRMKHKLSYSNSKNQLVHRSHSRKSHRHKSWPTISRIMIKSLQISSEHSSKKIGVKMKAYRQRLRANASMRLKQLKVMEQDLKKYYVQRMTRFEEANKEMLQRGQKLRRATEKLRRATEKFLKDQRNRFDKKLKRE